MLANKLWIWPRPHLLQFTKTLNNICCWISFVSLFLSAIWVSTIWPRHHLLKFWKTLNNICCRINFVSLFSLSVFFLCLPFGCRPNDQIPFTDVYKNVELHLLWSDFFFPSVSVNWLSAKRSLRRFSCRPNDPDPIFCFFLQRLYWVLLSRLLILMNWIVQCPDLARSRLFTSKPKLGNVVLQWPKIYLNTKTSKY